MTTASVFTGVKLSNESRAKLLALFQAEYGGTYGQVKASHMTIQFRGTPDKIPNHLMGELVEFRLVGMIQVEGAQVAKVELGGPLKEMEEDFASIPHVTVSVEKGVRPSISKRILKEHETEAPKEDLVLQGQVGFLHDRHGWIFRHLSAREMFPTPQK